MGSSILSEGCQHLDSQGGAPQCYYYPLNRPQASRLLLPRRGLERSDFVPWPEAAEMWCGSKSAAIWGTPAVALTHSGRQPVTQNGSPRSSKANQRGPNCLTVFGR